MSSTSTTREGEEEEELLGDLEAHLKVREVKSQDSTLDSTKKRQMAVTGVGMKLRLTSFCLGEMASGLGMEGAVQAARPMDVATA